MRVCPRRLLACITAFKISTLLLSYVVPVKSKVEISQNSVAFSEYMNFIKCCFCSGIRVGYANHFRPIISQRIFRFSPHISRLFCFASKIGNPLIFASTIFRYLARDTILQDPSSLHLLWKMFWCCWPDKGQLISKCPFGVFNSSKKWTKKNQLNIYDTSSRIIFVRFWKNTKVTFQN